MNADQRDRLMWGFAIMCADSDLSDLLRLDDWSQLSEAIAETAELSWIELVCYNYVKIMGDVRGPSAA